ncbi:hypothetical protein BTW08_16525 [Salinicola sp. MH3R3-1]|uniref:hypothetical protein n=1 Tax=Salinicola sp. MH3R3-1 TaxID=1928762 RepID=UPI00094F14C7|nr:hypothetical protein [Salinicola sp. MH3R3-1]OLO06621.1 hypothetical protein BTW08_16525 [Salinicola sp. MH3R3-1]
MRDQAAGLRAWAERPDSLVLGVIGDPGEDALGRALAQLPRVEGRRWQALRNDQVRQTSVTAWMLWVDTAGFDVAEVGEVGLDVADLYRCVKRALTPITAPAASATSLPLLLWLDDDDKEGAPALDPATMRLLANLGTTLKRFLNVELLRDPADWQRRLIASGRVSAASG